MKKLITKLMLLSLGIVGSAAALEVVKPQPAQAQRLCRSYVVTRPNGLYVYRNAGTQILTTLPYNNIVYVDQVRSNGWARIKYLAVDGRYWSGWVARNYLACYQQ